MDIALVCGPLASGKSTVATTFNELGAWRVDLDRLSRAVLAPGSPCLIELARVFGNDIARSDGTLDRALLASRAFASNEAADRLEAIELPFIRQALEDALSYVATVAEDGELLVIEVPLLDRVEDLIDRADHVLVVCCDEEKRKTLANRRGVCDEDFARRSARQPDEAYLRVHATDVFENVGSEEELKEKARQWYLAHDYEAKDSGDE